MERSPLVNFGPFTFDRTRMVLRRDWCLVPIDGRGAAILARLEAGGQVVTRSELLQQLWQDQPIDQRNLTVQIAILRQAMGSLPDGDDPIRTAPRVGYHLTLAAPTVTILDLIPSVAVFPFANLSSEPALAFFADGMSEDIIAALSRFRSFAVFARGSSFASMAGADTVTEAAIALKVRYILEGSVRREGRRLREAARLSDTSGTKDKVVDAHQGFSDLPQILARHQQPPLAAAMIHHGLLKLPSRVFSIPNWYAKLIICGGDDPLEELWDDQ